ncbi:MAG: hypothetical protein QOC68_4753 [Solirubrobacteraceae bacterium]|nr:hypothetical protein [Solirubrobacteraceae bacterium]
MPPAGFEPAAPALGERAEDRILHASDLRRCVFDVGRIGDVGTYWERGAGRWPRGRVTVTPLSLSLLLLFSQVRVGRGR